MTAARRKDKAVPDTFAIIKEFCSLIRNFYWAFCFRIKIFNQVLKFAPDIVLEEFVKEAIMPNWIKSFLEINKSGV